MGDFLVDGNDGILKGYQADGAVDLLGIGKIVEAVIDMITPDINRAEVIAIHRNCRLTPRSLRERRWGFAQESYKVMQGRTHP
jgi:hypothetical protein